MTDHARDDRAREIDTAALRALYEKAPAGEWWVDRRANLLWTRDHKGPYTIAESRGWGHYTGRGHGALGLPDEAAIAIEHATLEFAAQAHNSLPALLDEIDRLRAENERLRNNRDMYRGQVERQAGELAALRSELTECEEQAMSEIPEDVMQVAREIVEREEARFMDAYENFLADDDTVIAIARAILAERERAAGYSDELADSFERLASKSIRKRRWFEILAQNFRKHAEFIRNPEPPKE